MISMKHIARACACASLFALAGCAGASSIAPHAGGVMSSHRTVQGPNSVPAHVLTLDVYDDSGKGVAPDPVTAAKYLTWAAVLPKDANAFSAAGIKTLLYSDPNRTSPGDPLYTSDETTFAHDCSNNRITIPNKTVTTYLMDPSSPALQALWRTYVANILSWGDHFDAIFEDNAGLAHPVSALPCNFDQSAWTAASNTLNQALGANIVYNGLGNLANGIQNVSPSIGLNPTAIGGELEGCYSNGEVTDPMPHKTVWQTYETTEIQMVASGMPFICRGLSQLPANTAQAERIYMYASFLLTYDPNLAIISEKFATQSTALMVEPESQFVALDPLAPQPTAITALQFSNLTFGRQYANCYLNGQPVGACAAVVNADNARASHPFPWPGVYSHTLVLHGGAILDGGSAGTRGPAPPATMPGESAVIAIQ